MFLTVFRLVRSLARGLKDPEFRALLILVIVILATGTIFYHGTEKWRWLDAFYFSVTTLTTVGYGDFSPQTDTGKIFTIIYIFTGIGIILGFINAVAHHAQTEAKVRRVEKKHKH